MKLTDQLRTLSRSEHDDHSIGTDAADEIERLQNTVTTLQGFIKEMTHYIGKAAPSGSMWEDISDRLEAWEHKQWVHEQARKGEEGK